MYTLMIIIHVVVSLALILIVLLQTGKGAEMGAGFGGGSNQTIFGSRGARRRVADDRVAAVFRHDRQRERGQHEHHRGPRGDLGEEGRRTAAAEDRLV